MHSGVFSLFLYIYGFTTAESYLMLLKIKMYVG